MQFTVICNSSVIWAPVYSTSVEFENIALFLRLCLPSTLIRHESVMLRSRILPALCGRKTFHACRHMAIRLWACTHLAQRLFIKNVFEPLRKKGRPKFACRTRRYLLFWYKYFYRQALYCPLRLIRNLVVLCTFIICSPYQENSTFYM